MSRGAIEGVRLALEATIKQVEASLESAPADRSAMLRTLALLWAAHDELGLAALHPHSRARLSSVRVAT